MNGRTKGDQAVSAEVAAVLSERARRVLDGSRLAQLEDETAAVAEVRVGGERFALPLGGLRGCIPFRNVTPVPLSGNRILGVVRHEGSILPVYRLHVLLGVRWSADPGVLLLVDVGGRSAALECESVPTPIAVPQGALRDAAASGRAVTPIRMADGAPLRLIDAQLLLSAEPR